MPNYILPSYWEKRYKETNNQTFEWLHEFSDIQNQMLTTLQHFKNPKILNIGCGNSRIQDSLYELGYKNIVNIDISEECINQMKNTNQFNMDYQVMDAMNMNFQNDQFDLVLDKATLDCILCGEVKQAAKMLVEIQRVLKTGGIYFVISFGEPERRMKHLQRPFLAFDIEYEKIFKQIEDGFQIEHYIYNCKKKELENSQEIFEQCLQELENEQEDKQQLVNQCHSESEENDSEDGIAQAYKDLMYLVALEKLDQQ